MASIQHFCISNLLQLITQSAHHDNRLVNRWSVSNTEALICKYNEAAWTSQPFMHYIPHKKGGVTSWILWNEHLVSISEIKGPVWHHSRHYVCLFTTKEKKKHFEEDAAGANNDHLSGTRFVSMGGCFPKILHWFVLERRFTRDRLQKPFYNPHQDKVEPML